MKMLDNITQNGTYFEKKREWWIIRKPSPMERQTVYVWGVFDGATVELQFSPDGVEWFSPPNSKWKAKAISNLTVSSFYIRALVSGAGDNTSVSLSVL